MSLLGQSVINQKEFVDRQKRKQDHLLKEEEKRAKATNEAYHTSGCGHNNINLYVTKTPNT